MLVRLMYASRAAEPIAQELLTSIMKKSSSYNPKIGVTGVLCYSDDVFLQVLEGGRLQVSTLYNRIVNDPRHMEVMLLSFEEVDEREFTNWAMGQVDMSRLNPALLMRYSESEKLDPYAVSGKASRALFAELVATASVMRTG